ILYINEVSRLPAVAENRNRLVSDCFLNKSWNDRRVLTSRFLVGTKNVEIAKGNSGQLPFIREGTAMLFPFVLACGVRTFRIERHAFDFWNGWIVTVNCSRAAEDQLFHSRPRRLFQNNRRPASIDLGAFIRFLHRFLHAHHSREMKDEVHAFHSFSHEITIENRSDDELTFQAGQIALLTGAHVIEDANLCSILEVFGDMPTNEAGTSGN